MEQNKEILGITGGVGTGKSTVLQYMQDHWGAHVIQLDHAAWLLQQPDGECYQPILDLFGETVLLPDGALDRKKIAEIVFSQPGMRQQLNQIVWPAVKRNVLAEIRSFRGNVPFLVLEAALLLEDGYQEVCDEIWYVYADRQSRTQRLMRSRGYSSERIRHMLSSQQPEEFYRRQTQLVIDNSSDDLENTYRQIDRGLKEHGFLQYSQRQQR